MGVYRVDKILTVYDSEGESHLIKVLYRYRNGNGTRTIYVDDSFWSTAENRNEVNDEVEDIIKTCKYSFVKPF